MGENILGEANREFIAEENPDALLMDEYEEAFIGVSIQPTKAAVAVYDMDTMIEILVRDGLTAEDAIEHIHYNVIGSLQGENYPIVLARFDGPYLAVTDSGELGYDIADADRHPDHSPSGIDSDNP